MMFAAALFAALGGIGFFDVQVLLIDSDDGESETDTLVVSGGDSGKRGLSRADDVPARADQMNKVSQ